MTPFGTLPDGRPVHRIDLRAGDLSVAILDYGCILQDLRLDGLPHSLTRGFDTLAPYLSDAAYHGAMIGPLANRIASGRVTIEGYTYELERNQAGRIHLHSGREGLHRRLWQVTDRARDRATLTCALPDGAAGLPGNRLITAEIVLAPPATLALRLTGTTDAPTLMNLAWHPYLNLDGTPTWEGHRLRIAADHVLPTDDDICPTGEIAPVDGTPFDLRDGPRLVPGDPPLDTNFCLSDTPEPLREVLTLTGAHGLRMRLETDQPGIQIFDGRNGTPPYHALAIEAQHWPDAPAHPDFPPIDVTPDRPYRQETRWIFEKAAQPS